MDELCVPRNECGALKHGQGHPGCADARLVDRLDAMTVTRPDVAPTTAGKPAGAALALTAGMVGTGYAAISIYWGVGGTALLNTIGGSLERGGRAGDVGVVLLLWAAVVLKLIAAVLPLVVIYADS